MPTRPAEAIQALRHTRLSNIAADRSVGETHDFKRTDFVGFTS
jgi:hypothetical protein